MAWSSYSSLWVSTSCRAAPFQMLLEPFPSTDQVSRNRTRNNSSHPPQTKPWYSQPLALRDYTSHRLRFLPRSWLSLRSQSTSPHCSTPWIVLSLLAKSRATYKIYRAALPQIWMRRRSHAKSLSLPLLLNLTMQSIMMVPIRSRNQWIVMWPSPTTQPSVNDNIIDQSTSSRKHH